MKKYIVLFSLINVSYASTLCDNIVNSVSSIAFGNYLCFSVGFFLTYFSSPSKDDSTFFGKLKRFNIRTAVIQFMALLSFMTYMTTRFFMLNDKDLPQLLRSCSIAMYSICGVVSLFSLIPDRFTDVTCIVLDTIFFTAIYIIQMIFQVNLKSNFPSTGYMFLFQWISILSILFTIPLCYHINKKKNFEKSIYTVLYPFVFQIYLHVGYISFYLYCDEGYLSSTLLFFSSFILNNVRRRVYNLIFPEEVSDIPPVPTKDDSYSFDKNSFYTYYEYKAKALYTCTFIK